MEAVALVTGACSGIGRELAEGLGRRGYELVVVSHRPAELGVAATELRARHGVVVHEIVLDLARPEAASRLFEAAVERGVEGRLEVLCLNAGVFFFGEVADAEPERAVAMLQLHVVTPSLACTLFARGMRARRRGRILVVSSISAFRDFPGIAYYGTSKKYLRGFARALRSELAPYGVTVTCTLPGATATGLYDGTSAPVARATRLGVMGSAASVAAASLSALFAGRGEVVPGLINRLMVLGAALTPQPLIDLVRRRGPFLPLHPPGEPRN